MTQPKQRPEGALIAAALKRKRISARRAARDAGMSDARWRQIVNGYQSVGAGQTADVIGPADTIARMAAAVGVTGEQLAAAGRTDAAQALEALSVEPFNADEARDAVAFTRADLNRDLLAFTDYELLAEIHARMTFMASRLHAAGDDTLTFTTAVDGGDVITSRPAQGS